MSSDINVVITSNFSEEKSTQIVYIFPTLEVANEEGIIGVDMWIVVVAVSVLVIDRIKDYA